MKKTLCLALLLSASIAASAQDFKTTANGTSVELTFYAENIVRVVKYPASTQPQNEKSLVVVMQPEQVKLRKQDGGVASRQLSVTVDAQGNVAFAATGQPVLRESGADFSRIETGNDAGAYKAKQTFRLAADEAIYGLGTIQDGKLNRRGTHIFMEQSNLQDFQHTLQSNKGWGIYFDNYSRSWFDDDESGMAFTSEVADKIDYYFVYGGKMTQTTALLRQLSGPSPMFPLWTFGFWQSRERYKSAQELTEVVDKYRELQVPLDGIIQDWQYWGSNYLWNAMDFLNPDFSNPKAMIDHVHQQNAHIMISIWASFGPHTLPYRQLDEKGLLFNFPTWPQSGLSAWPPRMDYPSGVRVYMPYAQEAKDIYWNNLKRLFDLGIDAWWMDSTDPDQFGMKDEYYEVKCPDKTYRSLRNAFPLATVSGVYDHQRAETDAKRVFIMTRSAFAGQQRYGSNMWSGDVASTWDMLRKQVPAGLNFTLTGDPNFNTDLGGFFCGRYNTAGAGSAPRNPQYQELFVRWMQYGLFHPIFRSHGTDAPREIYQFGKRGEPAFDAIEKCIRLRYRLLPYIYSTSWQVTKSNDSYMMPLVAHFPNDPKTRDMASEYIFGGQVLVAPILQPQYTQEKVVKLDANTGWDSAEISADGAAAVDFTQQKTASPYLPAGADWYEFETNRLLKGGQEATVATTLGYIPCFVRQGSIIPLAPVMQYAAEKAWDDLEIRVYPGADARFTLYEDEGDGYNYERGAYTEIPMTWDDSARTLTIGKRTGAFPGMLTKRTFTAVLPTGEKKTATYTGTKLTLKF